MRYFIFSLGISELEDAGSQLIHLSSTVVTTEATDTRGCALDVL